MSTLDVADPEETRQIIAQAQGMAPLGGIFHLATIFRDKWLTQQVLRLPLSQTPAWLARDPSCGMACVGTGCRWHGYLH